MFETAARCIRRSSLALSAMAALLSMPSAARAEQGLAPSAPPSAPTPAQKPATPPPPATPAPANRAPTTTKTISTEGGDANGVVVLWPRVIPSATADKMDPVAVSAQARMSGLVAQTLPGRPITLRPKPERVCPQGGCAGLSIGLVLAHVENGCAAAALIGGPGRTARRIIPWAGRIELKAMQVEFRGQPESLLSLKELVPCDDLVRVMGERDAAVAEALKFAARVHASTAPKAP